MMNPKHYYHTPVKPVSSRVSCPVCHEPVYSRAGIHPQCAVVQSDPPRLKSKKPQVPGVLDPSIKSPDQPGTDVVVEPPIVGATSAGDIEPIVATPANGNRVASRPFGRAKGTGFGFNR
jgi:hypothetical protein